MSEFVEICRNSEYPSVGLGDGRQSKVINPQLDCEAQGVVGEFLLHERDRFLFSLSFNVVALSRRQVRISKTLGIHIRLISSASEFVH